MKIKGVKETQNQLNAYKNKIPKAILNALNKVVDIGYNTAKDTLEATDHAQKYGDELVKEIGKEVIGNTGRVYTPITKTPEMYGQIHYAEFGAGVTADSSNEYFIAPDMTVHHPTADGSWFYRTTEADKSPTVTGKKRPAYPYKAMSKKGYLLGRTDRSQPARFMYTARKKMETEIETTFKGELEIK